MNARPTTTVTILRGTGTDEYGDPTDTLTEVATGLPASILERTQRVTKFGERTPQIITYYTARLPGDTVLHAQDRIKDETTGVIYVMDNFSQVANPLLVNDVRVDLRRLS